MHDVDHPGHNNDYEIKMISDMAIRFNNKSVLENHHCYTFFTMIQNQKMNILEKISKEEMRVFRNICVELFLMTDPSFHFK